MATVTAEAETRAPAISRREFLYYIWGASIALFTAEFTGLLIWFLLPRFREGEFGGTFTLELDRLPEANASPNNFAEGRFWLVNLDTTQPAPDGTPLEPGVTRMYVTEGDPSVIKGVAAVYKVCTHLGCIYAWNEANKRFECPCHGSKYRLDGRRIESPAPRTLDRFKMAAVDGEGNVLAESETIVVSGGNFYAPLELPAGTAAIQIDTGDRLQGPSETLICNILGNCP